MEFKKIILNPGKKDALFVTQEQALSACLKYRCDVEFESRGGTTFRVNWSDMAELCHVVEEEE
jgi:hypothetical protein